MTAKRSTKISPRKNNQKSMGTALSAPKKAVLNVGASHSMIAKLAYQFWENDLRAHGRDKEHWLEAEKYLIMNILGD